MLHLVKTNYDLSRLSLDSLKHLHDARRLFLNSLWLVLKPVTGYHNDTLVDKVPYYLSNVSMKKELSAWNVGRVVF